MVPFREIADGGQRERALSRPVMTDADGVPDGVRERVAARRDRHSARSAAERGHRVVAKEHPPQVAAVRGADDEEVGVLMLHEPMQSSAWSAVQTHHRAAAQPVVRACAREQMAGLFSL